jgi:tRNA1(Val) A37 N6-methylase TrmN6
MVAAWRLPGARLVAVEAQEESVRLARKSARWNGIDDRFEIRQGDFRGPGVVRPDERFDLVYSLMTLHHIPDTAAILQRLRSVLARPG